MFNLLEALAACLTDGRLRTQAHKVGGGVIWDVSTLLNCVLSECAPVVPECLTSVMLMQDWPGGF